MFYTVSAIYQPYDGGVDIIRLKWKRWRVASTWWKPNWFVCRVLVHKIILSSLKMSNTAGSFGHLTGISVFRMASRAFAALMSSCIQQKIKKKILQMFSIAFRLHLQIRIQDACIWDKKYEYQVNVTDADWNFAVSKWMRDNSLTRFWSYFLQYMHERKLITSAFFKGAFVGFCNTMKFN